MPKEKDLSKTEETLDKAAAFTLLGGINLVWLCGRGAMPQGGQAPIGQVQARLMTPALLHVLIVQSKELPQLLVLYAMYLQAREAVAPSYPGKCCRHAVGWRLVPYGWLQSETLQLQYSGATNFQRGLEMGKLLEGRLQLLVGPPGEVEATGVVTDRSHTDSVKAVTLRDSADE